jgi:hypothetical protein
LKTSSSHGDGNHGDDDHSDGNHGDGSHGALVRSSKKKSSSHGDGNHGDDDHSDGNHGDGSHGALVRSSKKKPVARKVTATPKRLKTSSSHGDGNHGDDDHGNGNHGDDDRSDGNHGDNDCPSFDADVAFSADTNSTADVARGTLQDEMDAINERGGDGRNDESLLVGSLKHPHGNISGDPPDLNENLTTVDEILLSPGNGNMDDRLNGCGNGSHGNCNHGDYECVPLDADVAFSDTTNQSSKVVHSDGNRGDDDDTPPDDVAFSTAKDTVMRQAQDELEHVRRIENDMKIKRSLRHELYKIQKEMKYKKELERFPVDDLKEIKLALIEKEKMTKSNNSKRKEKEITMDGPPLKKAKTLDASLKKGQKMKVHLPKDTNSTTTVGYQKASEFLHKSLYTSNKYRRAPGLYVSSRRC